ncbi:diacylglycerol kinase family protein [Alkalibacterium psychrotolerans]
MSYSYSRYLFIVNEYSRKGRHIKEKIETLMAEHPVSFELVTTNYKRHASELAKYYADTISNDTLLIAVGGDGTLNEVVQGIHESGRNHPVAYIPTGSGNDFARSHDLSKSIDMSLKRILTLTTSKELDILTAKSYHNHMVAVNSIGFGIDGMVISKLDETTNKQTIGKSSYLLSVLSAYFSQKEFSLTLKGADDVITFENALLVVFANHKFFGGGIPIHPLANPTDSYIDIVVAEKISFLELLDILYRILTNESHLSHKKVHSYRFKSCSVTIDPPQFGQHDGELIERNVKSMTLSTDKQEFWI